MRVRSELRPSIALAAGVLMLSACRQSTYIGSNVVWRANHEGGDLSEWTADGQGGVPALVPTVEAGAAHSGKLAVHLPFNNAITLWRQGTFPTDCYYSAWFYLPHAFTEITSWTIMTFGGGAGQGDASTRNEKTILNLRTLPGGDIVLFVFDDRVQYLQWPLAVPPAAVPVMQWFQIEVFYRNANDDTGHLTVWLDGRRVYDIPNRPSGATPEMYWGFGNIPDLAIRPFPPDIFMDDAVMSLSRVGPNGVVGSVDAAAPVDAPGAAETTPVDVAGDDAVGDAALDVTPDAAFDVAFDVSSAP